MSYYPKPYNHIRDTVKVMLDLSNYATKKELEHGEGVDTFNLAVKKNFVALKAEVDKPDINKLVNVPTTLKNLKTKIDDLVVGKLKIVSVGLKKLWDVVSKEVVKNTKFKKLNIKVNELEKKIPVAFTLIQTNQCNTDKQYLEKRIKDVENEIPNVSDSVTISVFNTKIGEVENKITVVSNLVTTNVLDTKIKEVEKKIPVARDLVKKRDYQKKTLK